VGTQFDGITQPVGFSYDIFNSSLFLDLDIKIGPGGHTDQQDQTDPEDEPEAEGMMDFKRPLQIFPKTKLF
jgi:hypothetical protein